jgi:hypothetical protein
MRSVSRWILVLALLALPLPILAQVNPVWTAVMTTGAIDEVNYTPVNFSFNGGGGAGSASLGFLGASVNPAIVARYNVTNLGGTSNPGWTTFELGAIDTSNAAGNQVQARLIQVKPCTGTQQVLCTITSVLSNNGMCTPCTFPATTFDFTTYLYYVEVTVSRTSPGINEQATSLRIY